MLPALEELQTEWETKRNSRKYVLYKEALGHGLDKLRKYYSRLDEKPSFILGLGKYLISTLDLADVHPFLVLHPYYKLAYIKMSWGGPEEQAAEIAAGNLEAKDWQDEARQIVENTVSPTCYVYDFSDTRTDGAILQNPPICCCNCRRGCG